MKIVTIKNSNWDKTHNPASLLGLTRIIVHGVARTNKNNNNNAHMHTHQIYY